MIKYFIALLMLLIFSVDVQGQDARKMRRVDSTWYIVIAIDTTIAISGARVDWEGEIYSYRTILNKPQPSRHYKDLLCLFRYFRTESAEVAYDDSIFACPVCHKFAEHKPIPKEFYSIRPFIYYKSYDIYTQITCPFCNNIYRGRWIKRTEKEE